jgi:hypothetical protein
MTQPEQPDVVAPGAGRLASHPLLGPRPSAPLVSFTVDGRSLTGRRGEPILAALLANGLRVCRTMPQGGEAGAAIAWSVAARTA